MKSQKMRKLCSEILGLRKKRWYIQTNDVVEEVEEMMYQRNFGRWEIQQWLREGEGFLISLRDMFLFTGAVDIQYQ